MRLWPSVKMIFNRKLMHIEVYRSEHLLSLILTNQIDLNSIVSEIVKNV